MRTEKMYPEGLLGRKVGMTQMFTSEGACIPVTVIETGPCYVLDVKKKDSHGYSAVQFGFGPRKAQRVGKAMTGHFGRAEKGCFSFVREVRCDVDKLGWDALGKEVRAEEVFSDGDFVDVAGVSIGRGFSGVVRRYHVKGQPATRGTHEYRRHIGAIGCRKFPGRVFKNKSMPGRMGGEKVSIQNLKVVAVQKDRNLVLVQGGIPGYRGGLVVITRAKKRSAKTRSAEREPGNAVVSE